MGVRARAHTAYLSIIEMQQRARARVHAILIIFVIHLACLRFMYRHTCARAHTHTHTPVQVLCDEFCFRVNAKISKITQGTTATQVARRRDAFLLMCTAVGEFERTRYTGRLQVRVCVQMDVGVCIYGKSVGVCG